MSSSDLKKVANHILNDLEKTKNKAEKSARKKLEDKRGQILIVNRTRWESILLKLVPVLEENPEIVKNIWNSFSRELKLGKDKISASRLKELRNVRIQSLQRGDKVFYVPDYGFAQNAKTNLKNIVEAELKKGKIKKFSQRALNKLGGSDNKFGAQLGHEDSGIGVPTAGIRAARAKQIRDSSSLAGADKAKITRAISKFENTLGISIAHKQIINSNLGIKKEYVPIISWQEALDNNTQSQIERKAVEELRKYLKNIATAKTSTSLSDGVAQVLLHTATPKKAKVTGARKKQIKESSKAKTSKKTTSKKSETVIRDSGVGSLNLQKRSSKGVSASPLELIGILNRQLPEAIAGNMGSPRLNYRTGRFASSVEVTDITTTAKGFPSIGYTYMKYPYQTFEPGYAQGDPNRDPRKLIDKSIRDIAVQFALGRFYTRRV